ncbi:MAG: GNAT family N-acetyltransferase [Gammaproteobacteria bacterium]|nr:GNAT family N-acetyltransferase [Gammaproteobacteria bacterium]
MHALAGISILAPRTDEDFQRYYHLRWRLLREPWGQPPGSERDYLDVAAVHLFACGVDRVPIAVGRLHFNSRTEAQIRYMAVEEEYQRRGIGSLVLHALERMAVERGARCMVLDARESALGFYQKHGYAIAGRAPALYGVIPHARMSKQL